MITTFRRILVLVLMTAAIVALLVWSFLHAEDVNMSDLAEAFRNARWGYLPLAFCMGMMVFPLKALRWKLLIAPLKKVRFRSLLSAIMIGFMVNCIFSRVGELVRAGVLGVKQEVRTATALATIALERIFDMCIVVLFLMIALLSVQPAASAEGARNLATVRTTGAFVVVGFVLAVGFLVLLKLRPKPMTRWVMLCVCWLPSRLKTHVENFLKSFLNGLNAIQSIQQVLAVFVLSVIHWLFMILYFYFVGYCFPGLGMTFVGAILIFTITALGVAAFPLPGYLVVFQGSVLVAAALLSLPSVESISYAWLAWAANVPPIILIGFIFLWAEGLSLGELRADGKRSS